MATLMRRMGIEALYRKPNTSKRHPQHLIYPYLLRGWRSSGRTRSGRMDITYIPMARGFVYLAAIIDWHSRKVLALGRVDHDGGGLLRASARRGARALRQAPEIFNTDQGSQFTSAEFTARLKRTAHCHQHGRARLLAGQRVRRAAVAQREVRGGVPARPTRA